MAEFIETLPWWSLLFFAFAIKAVFDLWMNVFDTWRRRTTKPEQAGTGDRP